MKNISHFPIILIFQLFVFAIFPGSQYGVVAQSTHIYVHQFTAEHGLSQSNVNTIFEDKQGYLWIGTDNGLNRYNGYDFTIFRKIIGDSAGLKSDLINVIYEDRQNHLWIGTISGLQWFDKRTEIFHSFTSPTDMGISKHTIFAIEEDEDNNLWVGTNAGLFIIESENQRVTQPTFSPQGIVRDIMTDHKGRKWISSPLGIIRLEKDKKTVTHFIADGKPGSISHKTVNDIFEDQQGRIWCSTNGGGINTFNEATNEFITFRSNPNNQKSIPTDHVKKIWEDKDGNIWFGTGGYGIITYNKKTNEFAVLESANDTKFSQLIINDIFHDKYNNIWIGTYNDGLRLISDKISPFINLFDYDPVLSKAGKISVLALAEDKEKIIWIGTDGHGLIRYNPITNKFTSFLPDPNDPTSLSSSKIKSLAVDHQNNLYVGTYGGGLNYFNTKTHKSIHYLHDPKDSTSIASNIVWTLLEDSDHRVWLGSVTDGLDEFDPKTHNFFHHRFDAEDTSSIGGNYISKIYEDSHQNLWIGTHGGGLNLLNRETGTFTRFVNIKSNPTSIPNNDLRDIYEDKNNNLWIGSLGDGLIQFNYLTGKFKTIRPANPISNSILSILEDPNGNLWMGSYSGIQKYFPNDNSVISFTVNDGLQGNEFNHNAKLLGSDSSFYFGGLDGLSKFEPKNFIRKQINIPIVWEEIQLFYKTISPSDTSFLDITINHQKKLVLPSGQNVISIKYAGIDYNFPRNTKYAYQLDGFDNDWNYVNYLRVATYTNLASGNYVFKVKATNDDTHWPETYRELIIRIKPAWYELIGVRFLFVVIALFSVASLVSFRNRMQERHKKKLEKEVAHRTYQIEVQKNEIQFKNEELNDSLHNLRIAQTKLVHTEKMASLGLLTAGIAHEINNPVNFISSGVDAISETMKDLKIIENKTIENWEKLKFAIQEGKISDNDKLVETLCQELENLKSDLHFDKLQLEYDTLMRTIKTGANRTVDIVKGLRTFARSDQNHFQLTKLEIIVDTVLVLLRHKYDEKIEIVKNYNLVPEIECMQGKINQVILNILDNSIQAIENNGTITITIQKKEENHVRLEISDTGSGIPADAQDKIFDPFFTTKEVGKGTGLGLSITKSIMDDHQASIRFETSPSGTTFFLDFPISQEKNKA